MDVDVKISTDIRKMLKNEMSKVRNRWKAAAMKVVHDEHGLNGTHEQIKARVTFILQDFHYVYIRSDSPELWRETGKLKNISLEDKNGYCAKYCKILEHLDVIRTGRPTYFGALQTSLYQQGMATLGITIQHAGSDDDHFTIGDDITPDSAISPSMSPLQVPITCSKCLLYQAATQDDDDQSDSLGVTH
ncbi:hypothetical protein BU17DRAFT_96349 [Hysterangium stoloniferum]|nr:hypothetical protein BU17DRAFT_96349 [Hysterangium stoloniferum]